MLNRKTTVLFFISVVGVTYYLYWAHKAYVLDAVAMSPELEMQYLNCSEVLGLISNEIALPNRTFSPSQKAIFCKIKINYRLQIYRKIWLYGNYEERQQEMIAQIVSSNVSKDLPTELVIFDKQKFKKVRFSEVPDTEKVVYRKWID